MTTPISGTYAQHTVRSFRDDAIRTAVLIDDEFPSYADADVGYKEAERARDLYSYFHGRGLVCDVHNLRSGAGDLTEMAEKLRKSDLVVLDYHLKDNGAKSLGILRRLAESAHFNLVVLYTAEGQLGKVALRAAAVMHGAPQLEVRAPLSVGDHDIITDAITQANFEPSIAQLASFVGTGVVPWMREACDIIKDDDNDIDKAETKRVADMIGTHHLEQLLDNEVELAADPLEMRCNVDGEGPLWVQAGRSFVAILNKKKPDPDDAAEQLSEGQLVWDYLSAALLSWKPNFYRLMLSEIQNALELDALGSSQDWLDDELCLGLGMYLLSLKEIEEGTVDDNAVSGKVEDLTDRFIDIIRRKLSGHEQVAVTGRQVFCELLNTEV